MKLLYHEAKLASLSYILVLNVHRHYFAAYEIANVFTKKAALALPPFHAFTGCDKVNTSGHLQKKSRSLGCFRLHVVLYDRKSSSLPSTDEAKTSFFDPAYIT